MHFDYEWYSTSGKVSDLTSCFYHEKVTYIGGNPFIAPAPFDVNIENPYINPKTHTIPMTRFIYDDNLIPDLVPPFKFATYTANQSFNYDDTFFTDGTQNDIPIPSDTNDNPNTIVRTLNRYNDIQPYPNNTWIYTITKSGFSNYLIPTQPPPN